MVGSSIDRTDPVSTSGESGSDGCAQDIVLCDIIETLEEFELIGIKWFGSINAGQEFDDHMATKSIRKNN